WLEAVHALPGAVAGVRPVAGAAIRGPRATRRRRREAVRRAGARRPRAALRDVALTGRFAAGGGRWLEAVHALPGAVAGVRPVAGAAVRGPRAGRRRGGEAVGRAGARRPRAALRDVALTGRFAAGGGRWQEGVHAGAVAVAGVRPVAGAAGRGPRAGRRLGQEAVRRTVARRPRAALGDVALTGRCAADGGRCQEAVLAVPGAVAGVRPVAGAAVRGPRASRCLGLEAVRRTVARRTRAALGNVALTGRRAADGGRCQEAVLAVPGAVAGVRPVAGAAVRGPRATRCLGLEAVRRAG